MQSESPSPGRPVTERPVKLSLGVPVYNGENYLAAALDALLAQTFTDFELIISDNASTDSTRAICEAYVARDPRVRYYRFEQNQGAVQNFNRILELARGQYLCWSAHDDLCAPTFLERCVEVLDREPDVILCAPKVSVIDDQGRLVPERSAEALRRRTADRLTDEVDPRRWDFLSSPQAHQRYCGVLLHSVRCYEEFGVMRTSVARAAGPRRPHAGVEKVFLARLSLLGRWQQVPEVLFFSRWHAQRFSSLATAKAQNQHVNPRGGRWPVLPRRVRCTLAYWTMILTAPISWRQKARCFAVWVRFLLRVPQWQEALREICGGRVSTAALDKPSEGSIATEAAAPAHGAV